MTLRILIFWSNSCWVYLEKKGNSGMKMKREIALIAKRSKCFCNAVLKDLK